MKDVKQDIVAILGVLGIPVLQSRQNTIADFPSITFMVTDNRPTYTLEPEIALQEILVELNLWDTSSVDNSTRMATVEGLMRENGFMLEYSSDVDDEDNISHYVMKFNYITN